MTTVDTLVNRLWNSCCHLTSDTARIAVWTRGLAKIRSKYGVEVYLSGFAPSDMQEGDNPTAEVSISITEQP